jgi:hypothetical protein
MVYPNPKAQIPKPKVLLLWGLGFGFWGLVIAGLVPLLFGSPQPMVHIRWGAIAAPDRVALEQRWRLTEAVPLGDDRRGYVPTDHSTDTLRAIVTHPSVIDTDGINRRAFTIADAPPLTPRRGGLFDGAPAWMARGSRALAYVLAGIAVVLLAGAAFTMLVVERRVRFRLRQGRVAERPDEPVLAERLFRPFQRTDVFAAGSRETLAVIALFLAAVAWRFLTFTGFSNDHYAHLAMAQQVLLGDRPIRDFADPGWPLMYALTAIGWLVAGTDMATEWVISTAGFAIGAACTVAAAYRLSGSLTIATIVTLLEILIFPRAYSYPKVLMYAAGGWALLALAADMSRRPATVLGASPATLPGSGRIVLMAAVVAIAFLFRHDHGLFLGLGAATCIAVASRASGWRTAATRIAVLTGVTAVLLLPWIVFVALNGGLFPYLQRGWDFSRIEADATRLSAWPVFSSSAPPGSTANAETWLFWLFWALAVLGAAIAVRRVIRGEERWRGENAAVIALAMMAALVNATFVRESLQVRLPDAVVPAALLGAWGLGLCWSGSWNRRAWQRTVQAAAVIIVAVTALATGRVAGLAEQYDISGLNRGLGGVRAQAQEVAARLRSPHAADAPSRYAVALRPFFVYLDRCTSPSDRIIVTGDFPDVPVVAGRRFAGDGVVFGSTYASSRYQDHTMRRLRADPALFVLHMGAYDTFRERFSVIDAYVNEEYTQMADVDVEEGGTVRILVHRARRAPGSDPGTGWPCFQ